MFVVLVFIVLVVLIFFVVYVDVLVSYNDWGIYVNVGYISNGGYYMFSVIVYEIIINYLVNVVVFLVDGKLYVLVFISNDFDLLVYCIVLICIWGFSVSV